MKMHMKYLCVLLALGSSMAFGQATNSADVTGSVTDATGAVIPEVKIAIKDLDKGTTRNLVSNGAGLYDSGPIIANDHYTITFSKEGFGSLQRGPMILGVGSIGLNVQLAVGQATQQVVVNEDAPLLQTTSAELSATIPTDTLQTLPQSGNPDWQSFLVLLPGTSGNGGTGSGNPGMGSLAANGSMPFSTAMLDGSTISSPMSDNVINTPIFDSIGEVKMSDSNFSAQYGTGGIVFNQISKGGTNSWHGLGYDYLENTALNAANYGFGAGKRPILILNNFGWQASGPVIKNKVFFLIDWEHRVQHAAGAVTITTLPTAAMRAGDFTGLPTIYDPTTQTVDPTTGIVTRQSFISEYGSNKIPAAMLDASAQKIQSIFPAISATSFATNNFRYLAPAAVTTEQKWFGRFDADITSKNRLTGSSAYNYPTTFPATGIVFPVNVTVVDVENMSGQISDVHTFNSHLINEARAGWMGEYDLLTSPTIGKGWPAKWGINFAKYDIVPSINITNYYGLGPGTHANYRENIFSESDVVTLITGRHSLHFGGEFVAYRADSTAWGNLNAATLGFTGVYTQAGNTKATATGGDPYADFLLGYTNNWSASVSPTYYGRQKGPAAFVQDDWKFTPKLTLNLGLRWEGRTGWTDPSQNMRSFDTTITNPATNAGGGMWYGSTHTNGRTRLQQNQMNNWLPRVGVAYQLGTKMTVNGGFGMYTFPWNVDNYASCCLGNAKASSGNESDSTGGVAPVAILSGTGNENPQGAKGASVNTLYLNAPTAPQAYNGQNVSYMKYDQPIPRLYNWNLTVQRQLGGTMVASVGYVGSHGTNLLFNNDINQIPVSQLGPNDAAFRPYPQYQAISGFSTQARSDYAALQAVLARRMSNGLTFNVNYTWSHMTDDQDSSGWGSQQGVTVWQNAYVPSANHGAANFDVRQMFKAYGTYDLPFGVGRRYLNNNKLADEVIGGWTMSLTFVGQGGHPFTPVMASASNSYENTGAGGFKWYPNQVGSPHTSGQSGTINQWFDPAAYASPTPGTLGNMRRNSIYGPGLHVINGSIHKTFTIYERVNFELAANATNLINHASFANPDNNIGAGHHGQITALTQGGRIVELVGKLRF